MTKGNMDAIFRQNRYQIYSITPKSCSQNTVRQCWIENLNSFHMFSKSFVIYLLTNDIIKWTLSLDYLWCHGPKRTLYTSCVTQQAWYDPIKIIRKSLLVAAWVVFPPFRTHRLHTEFQFSHKEKLFKLYVCKHRMHYGDVIMGAIASQITSLTAVYSTVYSDADQRKHQSSAPLAFVWEIHRGPVNSPHKWPVTRKMFPFNDVITDCSRTIRCFPYLLSHAPPITISKCSNEIPSVIYKSLPKVQYFSQ